MKLKSILAGLENLKAKGEIELDIPNIENDSRKVQPGDMFIAIIAAILAAGIIYIPRN